MDDHHLVEDELIALALGDVGPEQTPALRHLHTCQACRRAYDDLSQTIDALLPASPALAPPAGFDARVLDRLEVRRPERSHSYPIPLLVAAAAIVGLIVGAFGARTVFDRETLRASDRGAALRTHTGSTVGTVEPSRSDGHEVVVLQVTKGQPDAHYTCRVRLDNGMVRVVGNWRMPASGQATWIAYGSESTIDRVELVTDDGQVWSSAQLGS